MIMNNVFIYSLIYILGVVISSFSQILLKKSADVKKDNKIEEYLNLKTIIAYSMFFLATLCTVFAYKYVPLLMGPILGTIEYIFISILSYWLLKERLKKKKIIGLTCIALGILIVSI